MIRLLFLLILYGNALLLAGLLPLSLFSAEGWLRTAGTISLGSLLLGFFLKRFLPPPVPSTSRGPGYYLWGAGYWGKADPSGFNYCGLGIGPFLWLSHFFLILLAALSWNEFMIKLREFSTFPELPRSTVETSLSMTVALAFQILCSPLCGSLWHALFADETLPENQWFRPVYCEILCQWLWLGAAAAIVLIPICF